MKSFAVNFLLLSLSIIGISYIPYHDAFNFGAEFEINSLDSQRERYLAAFRLQYFYNLLLLGFNPQQENHSNPNKGSQTHHWTYDMPKTGM